MFFLYIISLFVVLYLKNIHFVINYLIWCSASGTRFNVNNVRYNDVRKWLFECMFNSIVLMMKYTFYKISWLFVIFCTFKNILWKKWYKISVKFTENGRFNWEWMDNPFLNWTELYVFEAYFLIRKIILKVEKMLS